MEIHIDGARADVAITPGATIGQAVDGVRTELATRRRFAVRLILDGTEIVLPADEKRFAESADGHQKLEITTEAPEAICIQVVRSLVPFIGSLKILHRQTAEVMHQGHLKEAMEGVGACVQGWEILVRGMRHVGTVLELCPVQPLFDGAEVKRHVSDLEKALREFKKALDAQDLTRVADLIEYDLAERLPAWEQLLTTMLHRLEGGGNGGQSAS